MSFNELPSVSDIKLAAAAGQRITPDDVSIIAQVESELTGGGPIRGGPAGIYPRDYFILETVVSSEFHDPATAHSLSSKQMNFEAKVDELGRKPQSHYTQDDAREIQSAEVRILTDLMAELC
jgi:hypothetical protein